MKTLLFFLLIIKIISVDHSPIVILPGLYGSNLYATYDHPAGLPWYCQQKMDDELMFLRVKFLIPPLYNCLPFLSHLNYDNETQKVFNHPGVKINVHDFGGDGAVDYIIKNQGKYIPNQKFQGIKFYDFYHSLITYFSKNGYRVGRNFFTAPYDWRRGPMFSDDFWPDFKKLIEEAYEKSNGKKVTLIGFSMGCFMIQQFLAAEKISQDPIFDQEHIKRSINDINSIVNESWKEKYLEKVIFLAPSFGGSFNYFASVFGQYATINSNVHNEYFKDFAMNSPSFHSHFPNFEIFGEIPIVQGPTGRNYTAKQLTELVKNFTTISDNNRQIMEKSIEIQKKAPYDIGDNIPLLVIYNSQISTPVLLNYSKGWDQPPERINLPNGDGTIQVQGPRYLCDHWSSTNRPLICIDLNNNDEKNYLHSTLPNNPFVQELLLNFSTQHELWEKKGKFDISLKQQNNQTENVFKNIL